MRSLKISFAVVMAAFFLTACASVPGVPLERVGEVNGALGAIPNPPPGHEFANYSIDGNGVKVRVVPQGATRDVIQNSGYGGYGGQGSFYGGYDSYRRGGYLGYSSGPGYYGGGYGGGGFGGYGYSPQNFQSVTPIGPYQEQRCTYTGWGPVCNTVNLPIPPGALPGF